MPDVEPGDLRLDTVPERLKSIGDPAADMDLVPGSLDQLLDLARRDEEGGLGDAPWPPHFPKSKDEPKRVQPSRDAPRSAAGPATRSPAGRRRASTCSTQRGSFGSKPRTGQGHEHEFDEEG